MARRLKAVSTGIAVLLSGMAGAQTAEATQEATQGATKAATAVASLDRVEVTSQRRAESAQDVAVALTALAGEDLAARGVNTINKLQYEAPNVEFVPHYGSSQPTFRIRGVGLKDYGTNNASTVGVYVDEIAYPFPVQTQGLLFDLERVEILRGPQGTLYGKNSTGGAVNFISRRPARTAEFGISTSFGSHNAKTLEAYASGPLNESLRGRLAIATEQGGAWQHNRVTGEKLGDKDTLALRGQLELDASRELKLSLKAHSATDKSDSNGARLYQGLVPNARGTALGFTPIAPESDPSVTGWGLSKAFAAVIGLDPASKPRRDNRGDGLSLTVDWDLGPAKLSSITGAENFKRREYIDWDAAAINQSDVYFKSDIEVLSQELRLASKAGERLNWLIGAYYSHEQLDEKFYSDFSANLGYATFTSYGQRAASASLFGQLDYQLADKWKLVAGLRQEHEKRELLNFSTAFALSALPSIKVGNTTFAPANRSQSSNEPSGKLALEFRPDKASLYYASLSRGVKSGAFTAYNSSFAQQVDAVKPETLLAYEAGFKRDLSPTLRLNGAAFLYDYKNQQFQSQVFIDPVVRNVGRLLNIPKSEIYGLELELLWEPFSGFKLGQFLGYKKGTYQHYQGLDVAATRANGYTAPVYSDFAGQPLSLPRTTLGGNVSYRWQAGPYRVTAQGDYAYQGTVPSSSGPAFATRSYWLSNARLSLARSGQAWEAALWVRNLGNTKYDLHHGSFLSNAQIANAGQPRTVGVQLSYDY